MPITLKRKPKNTPLEEAFTLIRKDKGRVEMYDDGTYIFYDAKDKYVCERNIFDPTYQPD